MVSIMFIKHEKVTGLFDNEPAEGLGLSLFNYTG